MNKHWFLIASQKTAKFMVEVQDSNRLQLLKTLDNPLGRERVRNLIRKQAGKSTRSMGRAGIYTHSLTKRSDPHEVAAQQFAKSISKYLTTQNQKQAFKNITIYAEPHFLGKLRSELPNTVKDKVFDWVAKDLLKSPAKKLETSILPKKRRPSKPESSFARFGQN